MINQTILTTHLDKLSITRLAIIIAVKFYKCIAFSAIIIFFAWTVTYYNSPVIKRCDHLHTRHKSSRIFYCAPYFLLTRFRSLRIWSLHRFLGRLGNLLYIGHIYITCLVTTDYVSVPLRRLRRITSRIGLLTPSFVLISSF